MSLSSTDNLSYHTTVANLPDGEGASKNEEVPDLLLVPCSGLDHGSGGQTGARYARNVSLKHGCDLSESEATRFPDAVHRLQLLTP